MKKILLPLVMLQLSASSAFAQKWSVGLNAGGQLNSAPFEQHFVNRKASAFGGAASIMLQKKIKSKWQVGVGFEYQRISNRIDGYTEDAGEFFRAPDRIVGLETSPSFSLIGKLNRLFTVGRMQYYGGIATGLCALGNVTRVDKNRMWNAVSTEGASLGWRGGLQIGANLKLSQHWSANAELGGSYFRFGFEEVEIKKEFISTTCTVGIHYSF